MKKSLSLLGLLIVLIFCLAPIVQSVNPHNPVTQASVGLTVSTNLPDTIPINTSRDWEVHIINSTKLLTSGVTCNIHIYDEMNSGDHIYQYTNDTFDSTYDIEFVTNANNFTKKGEYSFKVFCNTSSEAGLFEAPFYVTQSGDPPASDSLMIFIYIVFALSVIILFYSFFMTLAKVVTSQVTIFDVLLSWGSLILLLITIHLGKEYLISTYVEDIGNFLFLITRWSNGIFPMIALVITMIVKAFDKTRPVGPQDIGGRSR